MKQPLRNFLNQGPNWASEPLWPPSCPTRPPAAPAVTRLTPPSALFTFGDPNPPLISRFMAGQRFDLQATVRADSGQSLTTVEFLVDNMSVGGTVSWVPADATSSPDDIVASLRAYSNVSPGVHTLSVRAVQADGNEVSASGNFEIIKAQQVGRRAKNVICLIGDGMGIAHRTAARLMLHGAALGKANARLAMDQFPESALIMTHSLNSIVTDSSPGPTATRPATRPTTINTGSFQTTRSPTSTIRGSSSWVNT
jgi:alkaline phosphatase